MDRKLGGMMVGLILVISIIFTLAILALTLYTISKGYGYEHTIDPQTDYEDKEEHSINGAKK